MLLRRTPVRLAPPEHTLWPVRPAVPPVRRLRSRTAPARLVQKRVLARNAPAEPDTRITGARVSSKLLSWIRRC